MLASISLVVAGLIIFAGNYDVRKGDNGGLGPAIVTAVICVVLAAVLFGYIVPHARNAIRTATLLAVIAVVSVVVFWSGILPILAGAAIAVAPPARETPLGTKIAQGAAVVLSVVTLAATLAQSSLF